MENSFEDMYTPKYIKISEDIKKEIGANILKVGDRIYSENEIMEKYGVSSTTARKSLELLSNEKFIERIQGKGSFVLQKRVVRSLKKIVSFSENMEKQNITPSTVVLEEKIISACTEYHKKLSLSKGDKILKLKRLKFGNNIPVAVDCRYINLKYFPKLFDKDLNTSLYKVYEQYNIKIAHTRQFLELSFLDEENAKLLNCNIGDPVVYIEGVLSLEDFTPIEYEENFWNARIFKFQIEANL